MSFRRFLLVLCAFTGLTLAADSSRANLITNGSFELGSIPGSFGTTIAPGGNSLTGWSVGGHGVDYIQDYWQAADGSRSVDLDSGDILGAGPYDGSISQTFATVLGRTYIVDFQMAANPDGIPFLKGLLASAAGTSQIFTFLSTNQTHAAMGYEPRQFTFVANDSQTTLTFASLSGTGYGPVIDDVSVALVPEPSMFVLAAFGVAIVGMAGVRRKRLT